MDLSGGLARRTQCAVRVIVGFQWAVVHSIPPRMIAFYLYALRISGLTSIDPRRIAKCKFAEAVENSLLVHMSALSCHPHLIRYIPAFPH